MAEQFPARALGAILFTGAAMNVVDVFSATNSSPWTAESFGGDPGKNEALWRYVRHGLGLSAFFSVMAAIIARSMWPILGFVLAAGYMLALYRGAVTRAVANGSTSWD